MTKLSVAEVGWTEYVRAALEEALDRARRTAADMGQLAMCDAADCGFTFDLRDPRHVTTVHDGATYHFCPACSVEGGSKDQSTVTS